MAECLELLTDLAEKSSNNHLESNPDNLDQMLFPTTSSGTTHKIQPPNPPIKNSTQSDVYEYLGRINSYIHRLGYHHSGEPGIRVITHLSLRHHMETARQIVKAGENIKCLHAMLLGIYLTNCLPVIERFPINFKSKVNSKEYRHVVLGIYLFGAYGALGLSRDPSLQDKPPTYKRLSDLLADYCRSYTESGHTLLEIKVGGVIPRDTAVQCGIPWKVGVLSLNKFPDLNGFGAEVDKLARIVKGQMGQVCILQGRTTASRTLSPTPSFVGGIMRPDALGSEPTEVTMKKTKLVDSKTVLSKISTSSKLNTVKLTRPSKSTIGARLKGGKTKKKKILKHKRYAEP